MRNMKRLFFAAVLSLAAVTASAADVGVSVSIGQPGFYGQIDIGGYPQPQVIYQQPRRIEYWSPNRPPIYLNVPPGHSKNWSRYCGRYNACGERVYFVRNNWYQQQYAPRYQQRSGNYDRDDHRNDYRGDRRDDHRGDDYRGDDHRGDDRGNDRGNNGKHDNGKHDNGKQNGNGNGHGKNH